MELAWGRAQTAFGKSLNAGEAFATQTIDICKESPKASYKRSLVGNQLMTGHMRLDMGNPLTQGNFIFFKGETNKGKSQVALSTIR